MINLNNLTLYSFDGKIIFSNANCTFSNDKLNFIIGKSGVGKSTLLAFLSGIPFKTSGKVSFGKLKRNFKKKSELQSLKLAKQKDTNMLLMLQLFF